MLSKELIRRIRRLEIRTRKVVADSLAGQYQSVFKGRGMAFSEVRQYQPGDEIRTIDWNVTARMREPYVKVFTEERELTVMLLVDVSASGAFGSHGRTKSEIAAEVAAQIAFSATANNDRVGLVLFSDRLEKIVPPRKGRKHVMRVVSDILTTQPEGRGTDLSLGLTRLRQLAPRGAVTFLISDFIAEGYEGPMRLAARRHDLVPVVIADPMEEGLPSMGLIALEDPETGERVLVDSSAKVVQQALQRHAAERRAEREQLFRKIRLDHVSLSAGDDHGLALQRFFRLRARRLAA
jgi:uncharacterized protein (DUF58 family)